LSRPLRVAFVASEVAPFSKTGGLADVAGALPAALGRLGVDVSVVTPLHRSVRRHPLEETPYRVKASVGGALIGATVKRSGPVYFLEHDPFFDRAGLYGSASGDYQDNAARFVFFCRAALDLLRQLGEPDVVHAHDWQAGLVPLYLRTLHAAEFPRARSVFTVHNLAYQGCFWHWDMGLTGLDWSHFTWKGLEFHGKLCFLKAGLVAADALTTVSPTYAKEIQTPEQGCGLDGVLRDRSATLQGILNGADTREWDPARDPHLPARYGPRSLSGKAPCKAELQRRFGLDGEPDSPLCGVVVRLAEQKGIDLLLEVVDAVARDGAQVAVLGTGERRYEEALRAAADRHPGRVAVTLAFDDPLAHLVEAGSDLFLMPSRYEPCGLNQIYALRYGTVPVVRATGGLADTVEDGVTGFTFGPYAPGAFLEAIRRALALYRDAAAWRRMMAAGMARDFGWTASARRYLGLYEDLVAGGRKDGVAVPVRNP
jgi:starch synthase